MKLLPFFILFFLLAAGVYSFTNHQSQDTPALPALEEYDHVIVIYAPTDRYIQLFYGGEKAENIKLEKNTNIQNAVVDAFNNLGAQGYELESTSTYVPLGQSLVQIMCYFKREKNK